MTHQDVSFAIAVVALALSMIGNVLLTASYCRYKMENPRRRPPEQGRAS